MEQIGVDDTFIPKYFNNSSIYLMERKTSALYMGGIKSEVKIK